MSDGINTPRDEPHTYVQVTTRNNMSTLMPADTAQIAELELKLGRDNPGFIFVRNPVNGAITWFNAAEIINVVTMGETEAKAQQERMEDMQRQMRVQMMAQQPFGRR